MVFIFKSNAIIASQPSLTVVVLCACVTFLTQNSRKKTFFFYYGSGGWGFTYMNKM